MPGQLPEQPRGAPKILIVITLAETGGAQTAVAQLLPALAAEYEVVVAAYGDGPLRVAAERAGARWLPLRNVRRELGPRDLLGLGELVGIIRREQPSIVHAASSKAGILARLAAAFCGTPCRVFTAHGWAFKAEPGPLRSIFYLWADRLVSRLTSVVVCVSEDERVRGLAARTCQPGRTVVIRNGVDVASFATDRPAQGSRPRLVTVGRLKAPKDVPTLLHALALLSDLDFEALLVGDGPDRVALSDLADELGLGDRVEFTGDRDDVPAILASADCFVLSTTSEGLPLSILEAMASALPVVASAVGGVPELVTDGVNGLLVPAQDAAGLAAALRTLLGDPDLRRRMGSAGRTRAEREFALEPYRAAHLRLYRQLLEQAACARAQRARSLSGVR